jgi:DNA polymerase elongation subunit (family B)
MGIVLKRRDNAPIVKIIYGGIIDIIMKEKNIPDAVVSFERHMRNLLRGDYPIDTLIISKTLSSYYKDPDRIAHRVLADRMAERDPGNKPMIGDRIPFVYVKTDKNVKLQGDKIEHPDYVRENTLPLDYEFYKSLLANDKSKMEEVLEAKITLWSHASLNCLKIFSFRVTFSVAASTTKSQPTTPSLISV